MPSSDYNEANSSAKSPSYAAAAAAATTNLKKCKKYPITPRVPLSKRANITFSPSSSTPTTRAQAASILSNEPDNAENFSMNEALTEAIAVSQGLADQVAQFDTVLRRLEQGFTAMQLRVATIEKEAEDSKHHRQLLENRISFLEEENARLTGRVNAICETPNNGPINEATIVPSLENTTSSTAKLQAEVDQLKQSSRNNEIILSGTHIANRIRNELDRRRIPLRALCVDIISRIPGLDDCNMYIEQCVKLEGDRPKLLVKIRNDFYRGKIFSCFFKMPNKKPFFINENLIPSRAKLFHEVRKLKKNKKNFIHLAFTKRGEIFYSLHTSKETFHKVTDETLASLNEMAVTYENNNN